MRKPPPRRAASPLAGRVALPPMTDPCGLLVAMQAKYIELLSGGAPSVIETPLLGRVEFTPANADNLGRLIAELQSQCARASGQPTMGRRPISFEACP